MGRTQIGRRDFVKSSLAMAGASLLVVPRIGRAQRKVDSIVVTSYGGIWEKAVKEHGEKAGAELVRDVTDKIEALKTAQKSEDPATIKSATDTLSAALMKIGEAMAKASEPPPAGPPPPDAPKDVDAEEKPPQQ